MENTEKNTESGGGPRKPILAFVMAGVIVLLIVLFLLLRPGGTAGSSGTENKPTAPVTSH